MRTLKKNKVESRTYTFGLTGGIGSGKSLVASFLRQYQIPVINLDQIGKEISDGNTTLAKKVSAICGEKVHRGGAFDRARVRAIVFNDPIKKVALEKLFHPLIWKNYLLKLQALKSQGHRLIVCEAALLIENKHTSLFDALIVVLAPKKQRTHRVLKRDKHARKWLREVYVAQVSDTTRKKAADYLLRNQGSKKDLQVQVERLITNWKKQGVIS